MIAAAPKNPRDRNEKQHHEQYNGTQRARLGRIYILDAVDEKRLCREEGVNEEEEEDAGCGVDGEQLNERIARILEHTWLTPKPGLCYRIHMMP